MCGIAGFALTARHRGSFPVEAFSRELLLGLESRGRDATGYVGITLNKKPKIAYHRAACKAADFVQTHRVDRRTGIALLHTRAKTKGTPEVMDNNHPVIHHSCFVVHNGSIDNDDEVVKEGLLETEQRTGEVDSYAIPVALEYHGWGNPEDIKVALHSLKGYMAIAAIDPIKQPGKVLLAKGEMSPLVVLTSPHGVFWSSEEKALQDAWGKTLGTPPKARGRKPHEFGWRHLLEGEYWMIDVSSGRLEIVADKFNVNARTRSTNTSTNWRPYTYKSHEWTCWPNQKDCVFGEDCGECANNKCECWQDNPRHPRLNEGLTWKLLDERHAGWKHHATRLKLKEEAVNPTQGVRASESRPLVGVSRPKDSPSASTSNVIDHPTATRVLPSRTGGSQMTSCFYCEEPYRLADMRKLATIIEGKDTLYECKKCQAKDHGASEPQGHDPKLRPFITSSCAKANDAEVVIEGAVQETSWEFKIPPKAVRYLCMFAPMPKKADDPDVHEFVMAVKNSFAANVKIIAELKALDEVAD